MIITLGSDDHLNLVQATGTVFGELDGLNVITQACEPFEISVPNKESICADLGVEANIRFADKVTLYEYSSKKGDNITFCPFREPMFEFKTYGRWIMEEYDDQWADLMMK